jgi:molecular chaperone DnaK
VEKALSENRGKISEEDAKAVDAALADAKKALEEGGVERINKAVEALNQASHKVFEAMYRSGAPNPDGSSPGADGAASKGPKADGDVIDAEYVDVDDKNKS